jgi:hypothetical protein
MIPASHFWCQSAKLYLFSFDFCRRCLHGKDVQKPNDADWKTKTNTACTYAEDLKKSKENA